MQRHTLSLIPLAAAPANMGRAFRRFWTGASLLIVGMLCVDAGGCSLPVFRYALDRWQPDTFHLKVAQNQAQDPAVAKFLRNLGPASGLNLEADRIPDETSQLLRPDAAESDGPPPWTGTLDGAVLERFAESPARTKIIQEILNGASAVWVVVESGDASADNQAVEALQKRLRYLQQVISLPAVDPNDLSSRPGPGPAVEVKFSVLRVPGLHLPSGEARPAQTLHPESLLLPVLAGPRSGLAASREPWFAAVFGRGRVLGAWSAPTFGDDQIEEICLFLAGACSCQVKRQNPGWDLLLQIDWDEKLREIGVPAPAAATATGTTTEATKKQAQSQAQQEPETVRIEPATPTAEPKVLSKKLTSRLLTAIAIIATIGLFARLMLHRGSIK